MLTEHIFTVAHYLDQVVLWILILLSVISLGLILERYFSLKKISSDSNKVRSRIKMAISSNSFEDIEDIGRDISTLEGRAVNYGLKHIKEAGSKGLDEVFHSISLLERPDLEKYLGFLATVGSNAPYIGLFGTVLGIMKAFNDLAISTDAGQQTVMAGISQALIATAAGLFVAIPAVASYNYFQKKVKATIQSLDIIRELCVSMAKKKGL